MDVNDHNHAEEILGGCLAPPTSFARRRHGVDSTHSGGCVATSSAARWPPWVNQRFVIGERVGQHDGQQSGLTDGKDSRHSSAFFPPSRLDEVRDLSRARNADRAVLIKLT